jgi:hypothetical protein
MLGVATLLPHADQQPVVAQLEQQMHAQMEGCIACIAHYHRAKVSCGRHPLAGWQARAGAAALTPPRTCLGA